MNKFLGLVDRLKEPSTYAGLGGLALLYGVTADEFSTWVGALTGVLLFVSVVLKELKSK